MKGETVVFVVCGDDAVEKRGKGKWWRFPVVDRKLGTRRVVVVNGDGFWLTVLLCFCFFLLFPFFFLILCCIFDVEFGLWFWFG